MKRIASTLVLLIFSGFIYSAFGQSEEPEDWTLYKEIDGLEIYYRYADCDLEMGFDERRVLLKFVNPGKKKARIHFHADLYYNGECRTCDDSYGEYQYTVPIPAEGSVEGECSVKSPGHLWFFAAWVSRENKQRLTKFELVDLRTEFKSKS